ncbi:hypothetical protein OF83DRAFT_1176045 [Amylostereum chailletii]|nr:hypothetical protein OF83DRAFT_1176045 [Amylostereum chailletii]
MDGFKTRKRALSPEMDPCGSSAERQTGTRVPSVEDYSGEMCAVAKAIGDINNAWPCSLHTGHCYLDSEGIHILLTCFRKKQWGSFLASSPTHSALEPPPDTLLAEWSNMATTPTSSAKPRGRTGPKPSPESVPDKSSAVDPSMLMMGMIAPLATMAMQHMVSWDQKTTGSRASTSREVLSPPPAREAISSPPLAIEDELTCCLEAFGHAKGISPDVIAAAIAGLDDTGYTPDSIPDLSVERIQELTKLPEGHAHALKKFAAAWSGKVEAKRARRA